MPGIFVINVGGFPMRLTNKGLLSTAHRVSDKSVRERYSMQNFCCSVWIPSLRKDTYQPSVVSAGSDGFREVLNHTMRRSESTIVPKDDTVSQCLKRRMQFLLGNVQHVEVEALQVVKYAQGGDHFNTHTNWFDAPKFDLSYGSGKGHRNASDLSNCLGSIFAYLDDNCEREETYFPHLPSMLETADGSKFALAINI